MKRSNTLRGVALATVLAPPTLRPRADNKPWIRTSFGQNTVVGEILVQSHSPESYR